MRLPGKKASHGLYCKDSLSYVKLRNYTLDQLDPDSEAMMTLTRKLSARALVALSAGSLLLVGIGAAPAAAADINTISGTVMADGSPVEDAWVAFWNDDTFVSLPGVYTDEFGYFEFENVPDGNWTGGASDPLGDFATAEVEAFTLGSSNRHQELTIVLPPWPTGTGSVSGVVTDSVTHQPILTAHIVFNGNQSAQNREVDVSAIDGSYLIDDLPSGAFSLHISAPGYVDGNIDVALDTDDQQTLNIELLAANSTLQGNVAIDGVGIPGLWVSANGPGGPAGSWTDGGGDYEIIELGAAEYTVTVGGPGTGYRQEEKTVTTVADDSVTVDFELTERVIGTISGTVSDEDGNPLEGICVSYLTSSTDFVGGLGAFTGTPEDGTFTLDDVDTGSYKLLFDDNCRGPRELRDLYAQTYYDGSALGGSPSFAEGEWVDSNGDDVADIDIRLVRGGSLGGHVSLQTSSGVMELPASRLMDATVYQEVGGAWELVPDQSSFVGGPGAGDYQVYGLYPGDYRVCFEDSYTGSRAFAFECWKDSATVESATSVTVTPGGFIDDINAAVGIPRPGFDPVAVPTDDLDPATKDDISSAGQASQGETLEVDLEEGMAGEWVSIWGHSTPTLMGSWVQVSQAGTVSVRVPSSLPAGNHTLVAQAADGSVIGWSALRVTPGTELTSSGVDPSAGLTLGSAVLLLGGMLLMLQLRRRRAGR